jgi:DNA polymerase-3 subunit delta
MSRPGYMFLICPDAQMLHEQINSILSAPGNSDFEKKVYWAEDDLSPQFWDDLTLQTLFGGSKAVILRKAHTLKAAQWDSLDKAVSGLSDSSMLFLCLEGEWKGKKQALPAVVKRRKCWQHAEKQKWVWASPGLDENTIKKFVNDWSRQTGISFQNGVQQALCSALPRDARAARLELDKMELAAGDEKVLEHEHLEAIPFNEEMEFFTFMDRLSQGGDPVSLWQRVLTNHTEKDSMFFLLAASLTREARSLWMILNGEGSEVKMPPFIRNKKEALARRIGPARVARIFDIVLEAELGIKSGNRKPEQALELMVASLTTLFAPPARNIRR